MSTGGESPLPCPFCGGENIDVAEGSTFRWRHAYCVECGATGPEIRIQTLGDGTQEQLEKNARHRSFVTWNTRHDL